MTPSVELIRAVQRLSFCQDLAAVMATLKEAARTLTRADGVTVVLRDGDLCHYADEDAVEPLWKGRRFPMESCISGWCMLNREAVAIPDIYADPRIPHDAYKPTFVRSLAMVPIRSEEPLGALGAYWSSHHRASKTELAVMQALADSASMAFANVHLIDSLREANQRKDEFMSMLAHELRNPLAPIKNALHILRLRPGEKETVERARELMERQVGHLGKMVDDLLDASRLTHGKVSLQPQRLDFARLVRQHVEDRRGLLEKAGIRLDVEVPDTPVWMMADATRLAQIVGNVLENAQKFTPSGGTIAVRLTVDTQSNHALLAIRDTGIGMEPDMIGRAFEVFAQADRSLDRTRGGLGLGLSITRELVALHGGSIEVTSGGLGQGSEFIIRLPSQPESPALTTEPVTSPRAATHMRILVVEDNRDAAESLRMLLEFSGYEVTVARSGREALKAASDIRPQIVLCDIGLPEMDGFAVARMLRENRDTARSRLIAVTGYGAEDDRQKSLAAGFDAHLVKPVDPENLLRHLTAAAPRADASGGVPAT